MSGVARPFGRIAPGWVRIGFRNRVHSQLRHFHLELELQTAWSLWALMGPLWALVLLI